MENFYKSTEIKHFNLQNHILDNVKCIHSVSYFISQYSSWKFESKCNLKQITHILGINEFLNIFNKYR